MSLAGRNVLISSAGRRVGLVRAFQEAVRPFGGTVIATDCEPELSAACLVADASAVVPRIGGPDFLPATRRIAEDAGVGLIIPTLDPELEAFAGVREAWRHDGLLVSVCDPALVRRCRDKRLTAGLFEELGIPPLREECVRFPRFVKPVDGSLSGDVHVLDTAADLVPRLADRRAFLHQELVDRSVYDEYTIDALYRDDGGLVCAVPRRRIEVRGGEISKGRTEKGALLDFLRPRLAHLEGARGCLTIQVFSAPDRSDRPVIGIEVNARFGGGYPMSDAAGARFAEWLTWEAFDQRSLHYRDDWADGVTFLRFDEHVAVPG